MRLWLMMVRLHLLDYGSVDDQIDALIVKYERDSIPSSDDDSLSESLLDLSLLSLLVEQAADAPGYRNH